VRNVEPRNSALLLLRPPKGLYQPYGTTSQDGYPEIFQQVLERVEDGADLRILSFGCATEEEVFSLRSYFQQATIVGLDINPLNITVCRFRLRRNGDAKLHFAVAGSTTGEASASYDAIFAMAVFRHGNLNSSPPPPKCDHRIRFADFEQSVSDLARTLKPGGLLVIQHAIFRFADTRVVVGFETVFSQKLAGGAPLYDRDNCVLPEADYPGVVFRKVM
jgi:SAM-dependent methyltransferase